MKPFADTLVGNSIIEKGPGCHLPDPRFHHSINRRTARNAGLAGVRHTAPSIQYFCQIRKKKKKGYNKRNGVRKFQRKCVAQTDFRGREQQSKDRRGQKCGCAFLQAQREMNLDQSEDPIKWS